MERFEEFEEDFRKMLKDDSSNRDIIVEYLNKFITKLNYSKEAEDILNL